MWLALCSGNDSCIWNRRGGPRNGRALASKTNAERSAQPRSIYADARRGGALRAAPIWGVLVGRGASLKAPLAPFGGSLRLFQKPETFLRRAPLKHPKLALRAAARRGVGATRVRAAAGRRIRTPAHFNAT